MRHNELNLSQAALLYAVNWTPNNVPTPSGNVLINNASARCQPVPGGKCQHSDIEYVGWSSKSQWFPLTDSVSATLNGDSLYNG